MISLAEISPNPNNPRLIKDERFKKLVDNIKRYPKFLEKRPIVIDSFETPIILGGNMRYKALLELGYKEIPSEWVKEAKDFSEEEKRAFVIIDNIEFGESDWDKLANEWDENDLKDWGLELPFNFSGDAQEDNYTVPDEIETDIVAGDLFEIGQHRLLCGDSTNADDVAKVMDGQMAELLFTSPPYCNMRDYKGGDMSIANLIEFIPAWMPFVEYQVINLGLKREDNEIVEYWNDYIQKARDCGYKFLSWNVWSRLNNGTGSIANSTAMFPIVHEWIFVFGKEKKRLVATVPNQNAGKTQKKTNRQPDGTLERRVHTTRAYSELRSVIECKTAEHESKSVKHPAMFPVEFVAEYIKAITAENQMVCEPFLGSGTTMVAAHQLNRKCMGIEISPQYCQIIVDRMLNLDPNLEVKRNGKPYSKKDAETAIKQEQDAV